LALALCLTAPALAQTPKESELKAEVAALTAMHEVIQPLWHDAWPKKDTAMMAGMTSAIEKHLAAIERVELPGILRDKTTAWNEGVAKLRDTVAGYKAAVNVKDDAALLKAAEALHTDYERLVKLVRPVLKEMDSFHTSLYVLYHYQLEPLDVAKASETIKAMKPKMDALNAATLPDRLKARQDAFTAQRARLSKTFDELLAVVTAGQTARVKEAIELMHIQYEKLEEIF
ncbi:MAG: hypothetical protein Q7V01_10035, partial [Vicinamibacterales bacterium]|nr:hypothetical protein [Vicinamibacterales bacterium]